MRGEIALERGDLDTANVHLTEAMTAAETLALQDLAAYVHALLAHTAIDARDAAQAEAHAAAALQISTAIGHRFFAGVAHRATGRIHRVSGRHEAARLALREARTIFEAGGISHELGRTLLELARLERDAGQPEASSAYLADARAIFTRLGASGDLEKVSELSASGVCGHPAPEAIAD
jgi:hypothetical protein